MGVRGRVAVVTGAGQGIGEGIAVHLAAEGARIVVNDVVAERVDRVVAELQNSAAQAVGVAADVSRAEGVRMLLERALGAFGRVDILVNNAGITRDHYLTRMPEEDWDAVLRVNLKSCYLCCREAVPHMMARQHGRIINVSSRAWLGNPGQTNYAASKGAVVSLTRTLALELARFGITVNAVAPALVDTPLFRALQDEIQARMLKTVPIGRIGTPADVAYAVAFFAADEASYLTGQVLYVCGGRSVAAY